MITSTTFTIANWRITLSDNTTGRFKENQNKYNYLANDRICKIIGCAETIRINRTSGLCDNHANHGHDLYLALHDPNNSIIRVPAHKDIIDALLLWSSTRNFGLLPFFSGLSFNTLGNIPDVTTLAGDVAHVGFSPQSIQHYFETLIKIVELYFPISNNSSYQPLDTPQGQIPAIVLAYTFAGLLICEEANRGDRWHCRIIRNEEDKTTQLGAAMPIAYFATRIFPWGVEMNIAARKLTL